MQLDEQLEEALPEDDGILRHPLAAKSPALPHPDRPTFLEKLANAKTSLEPYKPKGFVVGPRGQRIAIYAVTYIEPSKSSSSFTILVHLNFGQFHLSYSTEDAWTEAVGIFEAEITAFAQR